MQLLPPFWSYYYYATIDFIALHFAPQHYLLDVFQKHAGGEDETGGCGWESEWIVWFTGKRRRIGCVEKRAGGKRRGSKRWPRGQESGDVVQTSLEWLQRRLERHKTISCRQLGGAASQTLYVSHDVTWSCSAELYLRKGVFITLTSSCIICSDLISSEVSAVWFVTATADWVISQFDVAATNHSTLGSDEISDKNAP